VEIKKQECKSLKKKRLCLKIKSRIQKLELKGLPIPQKGRVLEIKKAAHTSYERLGFVEF